MSRHSKHQLASDMSTTVPSESSARTSSPMVRASWLNAWSAPLDIAWGAWGREGVGGI